MSIFYTADTHFGHENVIRFCDRPFENEDEMNRVLIANWNARVADDDDVYVVGDFAYRCGSSVRDLARSLKGRKHLVVGNHDFKWMRDEEAVAEFVEASPLLEIDDGDRHVTLCHYPMMEWRNSRRDASWHIHGHIHKDTSGDFWPLLRSMPHALNAGVDINHFFPVTFEELIENNRRWKEKNAYL